jgi:hypothetical protein
MATLFVGPGGYSTIQAAVLASSDGDTIVIAEGVYVEQVVVDQRNNLTLRAAEGAQVTIQAPADLIETARSSGDREIHSVLTVRNSLNVTVDNVDIDGHGAGNTVDEGGGAGQANFYGVYYRNSSGTLLDVDITGVRDPYPGGTTAGGNLLVDGVQRGVGLVVDNDAILPFTMTGGSITDFQKQGATFVRADVDISGVTITGGGAQTVIAQNGISINRSTGTISGNTIGGIGYAGPAGAYSGVILASSNTDLAITGNTLSGTNEESVASKVVGIWIYQNGPPVSGGEISGNIVRFTDVGIYLNDSVAPGSILIENNSVPEVDLTDPYAAGVKLEQNIAVTTVFDTDGSQIGDLLRGAAGNDVLSGLAGDDLLIGNAGDDRLDGGSGDDQMAGGAGNDTYIVDQVGDSVTESAGQGDDEVITTLGTYVLAADVERLTAAPESLIGHDFRGNAIDNVVTGSLNADLFRLQDGGNDSAFGLAGADAFYFGAALTSLDGVDGGSGTDQIALQGDYSGAKAVTLGSVVNVEQIALLPGSDARFGDTTGASYSYDITTIDGNLAAGQQLQIDAVRLRAGENFTFNGSAEMDGSFLIFAGKATDDLTGGAGNDGFLFRGTGNWSSSDKVDGGAGNDQIGLRGDYSGARAITFGADQIAGIETIAILSGNDPKFGSAVGDLSYQITTHDGNVAAGARMTIDATSLRAGERLNFDGSAETDGSFRIFGGRGNDVLIGGAGNDIIRGGGAGDTIYGGGGNDTFVFRSIEDSNSSSVDGIQDFSLGDVFDVSQIDAILGTPQNEAFTFIGTAAFSRTAGELRFENTSPGGPIWKVQGDVDGDGTSDFEFVYVAADNHPLTGADFIL